VKRFWTFRQARAHEPFSVAQFHNEDVNENDDDDGGIILFAFTFIFSVSFFLR
jgi:hypothetical protein